jgi:transporter family-2 protein
MTAFYYLVALVGGVASALQSTINGRLGSAVGAMNAAVISTTVALVLLLAYSLITGQLDPARMANSPPAYLLGGALGAVFVTAMIVVVPRLGVVTAVMLAIFGQLLVATIVDHFGLLGSQRIEITPVRAAGVVLVFVGFVLARSQ